MAVCLKWLDQGAFDFYASILLTRRCDYNKFKHANSNWMNVIQIRLDWRISDMCLKWLDLNILST